MQLRVERRLICICLSANNGSRAPHRCRTVTQRNSLMLQIEPTHPCRHDCVEGILIAHQHSCRHWLMAPGGIRTLDYRLRAMGEEIHASTVGGCLPMSRQSSRRQLEIEHFFRQQQTPILQRTKKLKFVSHSWVKCLREAGILPPIGTCMDS